MKHRLICNSPYVLPSYDDKFKMGKSYEVVTFFTMSGEILNSDGEIVKGLNNRYYLVDEKNQAKMISSSFILIDDNGNETDGHGEWFYVDTKYYDYQKRQRKLKDLLNET